MIGVVGALRVHCRPAERESAGVMFAVGPEHDVQVVTAGRQIARQLVATELAKQSTRRVRAVIDAQTICQTVPRVLQIKIVKADRDYLHMQQNSNVTRYYTYSYIRQRRQQSCRGIVRTPCTVIPGVC